MVFGVQCVISIVANQEVDFVNFKTVQLALRELRQLFLKKQTVLSLLVASAICIMSGPFGTQQSLGVLARTTYWTLIVFTTYGIGVFCYVMAHLQPGATRRTTVIAAIAAGVGIATWTTVLNIYAIPNFPTTLYECGIVFVTSFVIAFVLAVALYFLLPSRQNTPETPAKRDIALLDRLPFDKRGTLISLHAADHYVRVETVNRSELTLIGLADAIQLAQPIKGVQVHRSHWVALDQVTGYDKTDGTWTVILTNGRCVPVSRGYRADAITAGIIPARG